MVVVTSTGYITPMGAQALAQWVYDRLKNGAFVLGIYNGNTKIKAIPFSVSVVGSQVIVSAKDESADEYDFNKITVETTAGVAYFEDYFELKHKNSSAYNEINWVLPVLQTTTALGGLSERIPI
jgi:hypothetical protein